MLRRRAGADMVAPMADPVAGEMARILREAFPLRLLVLFGSRAAGNAREDSDYDVAVVGDVPGPPGERAATVRRLLRGLGVALDVLVYTSAEWEAHRLRPWTFAWHIEHTGQVLHAG